MAAAWHQARISRRLTETESACTLVLDVERWPGHRAGQHLDLRLTADDGYTAQRSYSIAAAPEDRTVTITVERRPDGEVSPYLVDEAAAGESVEVRGPLGGWFTWQAGSSEPLLLIAGGSGLVPLMSMLRHRVRARGRPTVPARVLISVAGLDRLLFREELEALRDGPDGVESYVTLTRERPAGWTGYARRVDATMLAEVAWPPTAGARTYVCGPTRFVEAVASALVDLGHDPGSVRTERFGGVEES